MEARHAEAALGFNAAFLPDGMNLGIDHHKWHEGFEFDLATSDPCLTRTAILRRKHVDDSHLDWATDLMGCQTAPILLVHGDDHCLGQFHQGIIDLLDAASFAAQGGMAVFDHLQGLRVLF